MTNVRAENTLSRCLPRSISMSISLRRRKREALKAVGTEGAVLVAVVAYPGSLVFALVSCVFMSAAVHDPRNGSGELARAWSLAWDMVAADLCNGFQPG